MSGPQSSLSWVFNNVLLCGASKPLRAPSVRAETTATLQACEVCFISCMISLCAWPLMKTPLFMCMTKQLSAMGSLSKPGTPMHPSALVLAETNLTICDTFPCYLGNQASLLRPSDHTTFRFLWGGFVLFNIFIRQIKAYFFSSPGAASSQM